MNEHEPECWCRGCTHPHVCGRCRNCICEELRACEQRVLDAAREAVEALEPLLDVEKRNGGYDCCGCTTPGKLLEDALAAIDALKEKPDVLQKKEKEMTNQIDKAITALAKQHIPVQVIECSCWHGNEDVHEKMVVGYACSYCCETSEDGKTAWCDDNHAGKPYHDTEEPWGAFYCPVINLLQEIRDGVK